MKNNILLLILIFSWISFHGQSDDFSRLSSTEVLKSKLLQHAESTSSIESKFIQEKHLWMLNEVIVSKGLFLFKKKNSVRWQYIKPIEYTIVIHDGKFIIENNDKINEFDINSNPMFREINKMIVTAIRGDFIDNPDFTSAFFESKNQYLANLTPVKNQISSMLTSIEIYFNKETMDVEKVIFNEPGDDFTSITFTDKEINSEIPDKRFIIQVN